jgi:metal-dependent amidase/aminoacylase/carboxypeptidase family protein
MHTHTHTCTRAQSYTFKFTIRGRGGHAAIPQRNIDPVPAAAALIGALQTLVSRETSPLGSAVLSVTQLQVRVRARGCARAC